MKIVLSENQAKTFSIDSKVEPLSTRERIKLSSKAFLIFFGLAIISVFIPVFHFVLVPLFLLLSVLGGARNFFKIKYRVKFPLATPCLACQKNLQEEYFLSEDLRLACDSCLVTYFIETP